MGHHHDHSNNNNGTRNLKVAFFLNLAFTVVEFVGGIMTNSIAILSDAVHDLGDSFSLGVSWYFQRISNRSTTESYTYGYKRYSVLGALVTSIVLLVGSIFMLGEAIPRLFDPEDPDAKGMIFFAILGVLVNGLAVLRLRRGSSLNERAVMLHLFEDVLGWIAVLIGAIVMYFYDIPIIDPILSICISIYILFNVYKNLRSVMQVILQAVPENIHKQDILDYLENHRDLCGFHDMHLWSLDGNYNVLTVHVVLEKNMNEQDLINLKGKIREDLKAFHVDHATIEVDFKGYPCAYKTEEHHH